jgi:hypothetical protein
MASVQILEQLARERESRIAVTTSPPFFALAGAASELCPVGSVAIVAALPNTDLFEKIEAALEADDRDALDTVIKSARSTQPQQKGPSVSDAQAAAEATGAEDNVDVRYLGRTLISNVFATKDVDFVRYFLPYAGGPLVATDFQVAHYVLRPEAKQLRVLIAAHPPQLSKEQEALVRRLPAQSREMAVGSGDVVIGTPAALFATVTADIVGAAIGYGIGRALQHVMVDAFSDLEKEELKRNVADAGKFKNVAPTVAVQMLIAAKREALSKL